MVGHAKGITRADEFYFQDHAEESDRLRLVTADDVDAPPSTTHVRVYEHKDFNGHRTGHWHRMFLRRVVRQP